MNIKCPNCDDYTLEPLNEDEDVMYNDFLQSHVIWDMWFICNNCKRMFRYEMEATE